MRPASTSNPNYIVAESLENYSIPVTEYIPRDFFRVRHPSLAWVGAFLRGIAGGLSAKQAADQAGVSRGEAYAERDANPDFKAAWEEAIRLNTENLEAAAHDRAIEKSDLLMMFILKSRDPAKYNDKHQGNDARSLSIEITHRYPDRQEQPTIEVESRNVPRETLTESDSVSINQAVLPDSKQLASSQADPIDATPRKD